MRGAERSRQDSAGRGLAGSTRWVRHDVNVARRARLLVLMSLPALLALAVLGSPDGTSAGAPQPVAQLTMVKVVSAGAPDDATAWTLTVTGPDLLSGAGPTVSGTVQPGSYALTEIGPDDYTPSPWSCPGAPLDGNVVTLAAEDDVTCTITNTFAPTTTSTTTTSTTSTPPSTSPPPQPTTSMLPPPTSPPPPPTSLPPPSTSPPPPSTDPPPTAPPPGLPQVGGPPSAGGGGSGAGGAPSAGRPPTLESTGSVSPDGGAPTTTASTSTTVRGTPPVDDPTTDTGPTPQVDPGDELTAERLRECAREAANAKVSYTPTRQMLVDEETTVIVIAFLPSEEGPAPEPQGDAAPATTVVQAELACSVRAELDGGDHFAVSPDERQPGSFARRSQIRWFWDVTPLATGRHDLVRRITPILSGDEGTFEDTPQAFEQTIEVSAQERSLVQQANDGVESFVNYPLVRGAGSLTAFFALVAVVWHWILRRPWPWAKSIVSPEETGADEPRGYL